MSKYEQFLRAKINMAVKQEGRRIGTFEDESRRLGAKTDLKANLMPLEYQQCKMLILTFTS